MEFLEDVLKRYGITAIYWPAEEPIPPPEERADADALWRDILRASPNWPDEFSAAIDRDRESQSGLPLAMTLGDIRAESDKVGAALKAYEFAVLEEDDPASLCELGYLLLQRCRVEQLPLSDKDFEGPIDFGGETLSISSCLINPDDPGPEFPDKHALLPLAIRAFGLAYARCVGLYFKEELTAWAWGNKWRELVALDGLRAAFLEDDNLDGLEAAIGEYCGWMDDCEEGGLALSAYARVIAKKLGHTCTVEGEIEPDPERLTYRFDLKFRDAQAYLRGRRKAPPRGEPDVMATLRLITWQLREVMSQFRKRQLTPEEVDSLGKAIAQKLDRAPTYIMEIYEEPLRSEHGDKWLQLPPEVRELLKQAEFLRLVLPRAVDADWSPMVLHYVKATEALLQRTLGQKLDAQKNLPEELRRLNGGFPFAGARIETFRKVLQSPAFSQVAPTLGIPHNSRVAGMAADLDRIVKHYRTPAVHRAEPTFSGKALDMRTFLFGGRGQECPLLWRINSLCSGG